MNITHYVGLALAVLGMGAIAFWPRRKPADPMDEVMDEFSKSRTVTGSQRDIIWPPEEGGE